MVLLNCVDFVHKILSLAVKLLGGILWYTYKYTVHRNLNQSNIAVTGVHLYWNKVNCCNWKLIA